ncbi:MAG: Crp/Fnr family transcriptional regulator [Candidatus Methylomirabilia bacterium]
MLFPGSRIWHEGSAADLASLTDEIKTAGFSGHIVLEFQDSIDVVICVNGEFLRVIEKIGRRILSTKKYREIWGKCQIKTGRMTVFELPPQLVRRLRLLHGRRLLCSGTFATGCDPGRIIAGLRARDFSGILDCVTPTGKLLLDCAQGKITGCYYTEYEGLSRCGLAAFTAWHRGFVRSTHPSFFFASEPGGSGESQLLDEILMDYSDQIRLPLTSSIERLYRAFGREAAAGEEFVVAGALLAEVIYLIEGEIELIPVNARGWAEGISLKPGEFFGLGRLHDPDRSPASVRARVPSRYLAFDAEALDVVFANSPALATQLVRAAAKNLGSVRARLEALRTEPRLSDVEAAVLQALLSHPRGGREGVTSAELFRELTQSLPLSLPEIDALFRKLTALEGVRQAGGRVTLSPREY